MATELLGRTVAVYGSGGAPYHHLAFAALHGAEARIVRAEDIREGALDQVDVLVMPGGGLQAMHGLLAPLGLEGARVVRAWVESGGTYLSSCAGSFLPLALEGAARDLHPEAEPLRMVPARLANPGDATLGGLASPGVGTIQIRVGEGHALRNGVSDELEVVHYNGPFFELLDGDDGIEAFAWPVAATPGFTPAERFMPSADAMDSTTFDRCVLNGAAMAVRAKVGEGQAILFGSHPEFGIGRLQMGWGSASKMLLNAMRLAPAGAPASSVSSRGATEPTVGPFRPAPQHPGKSVEELAEMVASSFEDVADAFGRLAENVPESWLHDEVAPSFAGTPARRAWVEDVAKARSLAESIPAAVRRVASTLSEADRGLLDDVPRPNQDVGAMGLLQMGVTILDGIGAARLHAERDVRTPAHAYDGLTDHPFHLAVGTYLSAAGLTASAFLVAAILSQRHGDVPSDMRKHLFLEER